jgi:beta-ribofuranosylaminobenzene 5'-phosphate synthase
MIEVRTCARLHMGLLDINGEQGRLYGSIGVAVSHPRLVLRADSSDKLIVEGLDTERVVACAQRFINHYGVPKGAYLNLVENIPAHVGLGSGTQLAMAIGAALSRLAGLKLSTEEIAIAVGRGAHSGVGISTFRRGGFVLDGGHRIISNDSGHSRQIAHNKIPPLIFQHTVPEDWFFVLIIPEDKQGFSGEKENSALVNLPEAPAALVEKISRLLLMKMLPALVEEDIISFGKALTDIQCMVGDCFASVQGGRYASPFLDKLVRFLLDKGAAGAGQSSWGPTVYGLVKGSDQADHMVQEVRAFLTGAEGGQVFSVRPHNDGAEVEILDR